MSPRAIAQENIEAAREEVAIARKNVSRAEEDLAVAKMRLSNRERDLVEKLAASVAVDERAVRA